MPAIIPPLPLLFRSTTMLLRRLIFLGILMCIPAALQAQAAADTANVPVPVVQTSDYGQRFTRMAVPAAVGSGVGLLGGLWLGVGPFYSATGCCGGGDDPGLASGLAGALIGATVGSALGAYVTRDAENPVSWSRALLGATVGILPGVLVGLGGAVLGDGDHRGLVVGFSVGQGMTTAGFALPYP